MYIYIKVFSPLHTSQVRKLVRARKSVPARKLVRVWSLNSKVNTYLFTDFYGIVSLFSFLYRAERWRAVKDGEGLMLLYYGTSQGCPLCTVLVDGEKKSYKVKVHTSNMVAQLKTACPEAPELLDCMDNLKAVMSIVENAVICGGCSYAKYETWIEERLDGECFHNQSGECLARLDEPCDCTPDRCIRSVACPLLLPGNGVSVCMACKDMDCTLQSGLSRHENNTPPGSRTADVHLSRADLIVRYRLNLLCSGEHLLFCCNNSNQESISGKRVHTTVTTNMPSIGELSTQCSGLNLLLHHSPQIHGPQIAP